MLTLTARLASLIDADDLLRMAEPLSDLGRATRSTHSAFGRERSAEWARDREECLALSALDPSDSKRLSRELRRAERLGDSASRLRSGTADVADLFRAKHLVYIGHRVALILVEGGAHRPCERLPMTAAERNAFLRVLNPEPELGARFTLSDSFDATMAAARRDALVASDAAVSAKRVFCGELEERYGPMKFGRLRTSGDQSQASKDPHLRWVSGDQGEHLFEPVWSKPVQALLDASLIAEERAKAEEQRVIGTLNNQLVHRIEALVALERWIGQIDFAFARVRLALRFGTWPKLGDSLKIERGWVPRVRDAVESSGGRYQPQSFDAPDGVALLCGPNMGGKTVALRLAGTVQYLAQLGYPVPADEAEFIWVDRIDYVGSELSDLEAGLSSFAGEMTALAEVLDAGQRQLVLVDELGRSTNPREGAALADAAVAALAEIDGAAMVVTHFPIVGAHSNVRAWRVVGLENVNLVALRADVAERGWQAALNSVMDFALTEDLGLRATSDALRIAELLGVPDFVIAHAARTLGTSDED